MLKKATIASGGSITVGSFGSSPDDKGASASGSTITMQPADATHPGLVSAAAQTFGGAKTFAAGVVSTTVAASGLISSTVASGSNFLKSAQGARLSLGSDSRYFSDDGTNLLVTGPFLPATGYTQALGSSANPFSVVYAADAYANTLRNFNTGTNLTAYSYRTDAAAAVAFIVDTVNTFSTAGSKLLSLKNNTSEKVFIDKDGQLENTTAGYGIILKSPDGTRYLLTIANGGTVNVAAA